MLGFGCRKKKRPAKKKPNDGSDKSVDKSKKPKKRREETEEDLSTRELNETKVTVRNRSSKRKKKRKDWSDTDLNSSTVSASGGLSITRNEGEMEVLNGDGVIASAGDGPAGEHGELESEQPPLVINSIATEANSLEHSKQH